MALVSYDSSDCSDLEDQESTDKKAEVLPPDTQKAPAPSSVDEIPKSLFKDLPKPAQKIVKEEDDEFLHKHEATRKEKAKISIPSLSDFKDVGLHAKKVFHPSGKKSSLLSMLPEPKFSSSSTPKTTKSLMSDTVKSLMPDTVKLKMNNKPVIKSLIPDSVKQRMINTNPCPPVRKKKVHNHTGKTKQAASILGADYSDSDGEEDSETGTDFFSFNSKEEITLAYDEPGKTPTSQYNLNEISQNSAQSNDHSYGNPQMCDNNPSYDNLPQDNYPSQSTSSSGSIELDDEAIRQLCGSRKRNRKEAFEVINVDQNEVLSNAHEILMKNLMDDTTPRVSASKIKGNGPTGQEKRKHQITYLAHQAKANEAELQNQWAQNRMTKRQTQSKYGF